MGQYSTNEDGFLIIETFEGLAKKVLDAAGKWTGLVKSYKPIPDKWDEAKGKWIVRSNWTCGFGQEGAFFKGTPAEIPVNEHTVVTEQQAKDGLRWFVANVVDPLVWKHFNPRSQAEHNALASWVYNIHHDKLEAGEYNLPTLVNSRLRDMDALMNKWLEYCMTPGAESGLVKRRIAEVCMFLGLPWNAPAVWGFIKDLDATPLKSKPMPANAAYVHPTGKYAATVDPHFVIDIARNLVEAVATPPIVPPKPVPPKAAAPAPKPAAAPPATDAPKAETKPTATVKKPPSPNTKAPAEVGLDPNAGLKHVSESDRARGWLYQQFGLMLLRLSTLGMFGTGAKAVADTLQTDQTLMAAMFELAIPLALAGGGVVTSYVTMQYGLWKEYQGRAKGTQALYI